MRKKILFPKKTRIFQTYILISTHRSFVIERTTSFICNLKIIALLRGIKSFSFYLIR